ncbi:uncharacterized protein LOC133038006 [Cannabis sativa]|uniref:uncharacterized protein LOC133038006 n=1 Tax=Cannabis sativa TaxID=3483 RepID=UPI0029CA78C7|nr:uncharacterized protein LOC133038006 [Cannabis sativa]
MARYSIRSNMVLEHFPSLVANLVVNGAGTSSSNPQAAQTIHNPSATPWNRTQNLLSVSKFALDNNVFFEFHANVCYVKDQVTRDTLLTGTLHNGMYTFDLGQFKMFPLSQSSLRKDVQSSSLKSVFTVTNYSDALKSNSISCPHCSKSPILDFELWHNRLVHSLFLNPLFPTELPALVVSCMSIPGLPIGECSTNTQNAPIPSLSFMIPLDNLSQTGIYALT